MHRNSQALGKHSRHSHWLAMLVACGRATVGLPDRLAIEHIEFFRRSLFRCWEQRLKHEAITMMENASQSNFQHLRADQSLGHDRPSIYIPLPHRTLCESDVIG